MISEPRFRALPMPSHSLVLLVVWVMLNDFSVGQFVLGGFLAWLIPLFAARLSNPLPQVKKHRLALFYFFQLLYDIARSNIEMAYRVLGSTKKLTPGFFALPLEISGDFPITVLASTISLTPGTVSVELSEDHQWLYIHALHIDNEQDMIDTIKQRYEKLLKEIFGC